MSSRIVVLGGARTPVGSFGGALKDVPPHELRATAARAAWRVYRRPNPTPIARALAIGLLAAFSVILTHAMFDMIFWGIKAGIFLWAVLALSLLLTRTPTPQSTE